jgi:hypothetical protein
MLLLAKTCAAARGYGSRYHARIVASSPPDLTDLVTRIARRGRLGRREKPFRFLLDGRLFRLLCGPGQTAALDNFRASLAHHRLAPESGGFPDLEMTPLAILDLLGIEPPQFPALSLPASVVALKAVDLGILLAQTIKKEFAKAPELEASSLLQRVEELRKATDPAAHELFDLCLTRSASREELKDEILEQLTFDALFRFRFPEERRDEMNHLFSSFLLDNKTQVSGLTKMRLLKTYWDKSLERILKKHPTARGEILAVDQEIKPRTFKDFLGWEVVHYSVLGYTRKRIHPVAALTTDPEETLIARCRAHKTALRAFLDEIPREELAGVLRPRIRVWTPGWLVSCGADGTFEAALSTGEVPIWAGPSPSPPAPLPRAGG